MSALIVAGAGFILSKVFDEVPGRAIDHFLERRRKGGQAILARQIAKGRPWLIADDAAASAMLTYRRAIEEGVARLNLEIMARVMVSGASEREFRPDEFRRQAETISNLSHDEIVVLAMVHRARTAIEPGGEYEGKTFTQAMHAMMVGKGKQFPDGEELGICLSTLQRTGYILSRSVFGGSASEPSRAYDRLIRLVDLEDALRESDDRLDP